MTNPGLSGNEKFLKIMIILQVVAFDLKEI